jgi:hypothetical protein
MPLSYQARGQKGNHARCDKGTRWICLGNLHNLLKIKEFLLHLKLRFQLKSQEHRSTSNPQTDKTIWRGGAAADKEATRRVERLGLFTMKRWRLRLSATGKD